jgi:hypothetical protein
LTKPIEDHDKKKWHGMWHSASLVLLGIDTALGFDVVVSQRKDQPHILKIIIIIKTSRKS